MHRPKILHIITRLIRGGADENTVSTVNGLMEHRYDVDLLVGGESDFSYLNKNRSIRFLIVPELRRDIQPARDLIAFFKILKIIKNNDYNIVHTHTAKAGILGRLAAKVAGTPLIVHTVHGVTFHEFLNPIAKNVFILLERLAGSHTDAFVTVGDALKEIYLDRKIGTAKRYVTIRSGMSLGRYEEARQMPEVDKNQLRSKLGIHQEDLVIGTASRLEVRKGHTYFLQAAAQITQRFPNCKFLIAGDGEERSRLEHEASALNLGKNVRFLGFKDDLHNLLPLLDIFSLTSLWEGLPRVLVQAAIAARPIVTFDVEGASEVVHDGVNGFIVPVRDVGALVSRLCYLVRNPNQAKCMGLRGREIVGNSWDSEKMITDICNLYRSLTKPSFSR